MPAKPRAWTSTFPLASDDRARMGHFAFGWPGMDPAAAAAMAGALPLPVQVGGGAYCVDPAMYSSVPPPPPPQASVEAEAAARRRQEEENGAIRLVHLLVTCAGAIQAGDYATAAGSLDEAGAVLATVPAGTGIGRVTTHFANALAKRVFPTFEHPSLLPELVPRQDELYRQFYEAAGPYLKFSHYMANQAIFEALEGCSRVHIVDLGIMQGAQWPALIQALAFRPGGPPTLRITGVGPPPSGGRDDLRDVGIRLSELARSLNVPFSFRGITGDQLDGLQPWMLQLVPGEAVAVNSILQLHRLLVDPDAASSSLPSPIDAVLGCIRAMQPKVFTVVEQEADHNKTALVDRFINALFYYGAVFDSMEGVSRCCRTGAAAVAAEGYLQAEIFDIVCGEGSGRAERHELLHRWLHRLGAAGMVQVPFTQTAAAQAVALLRVYPGAGYRIQERAAGCLTLAWHGRPLLSASVWRPAAPAPPAPEGPQINAAAAAADAVEERNGNNSSSEGSGHAAVDGATE